MMKTLIFLLLLSTTSYSQVLFRMPMNIREVTFNNQISCNDNVEVIWGFNRDTICFLFNDKSYCYYPATIKSKGKLPKHINPTLKGTDLYKHRFFILQDNLDELYSIKIIIHKDGSILIFITNVIYGYPNYTLCFDCSKCIN